MTPAHSWIPGRRRRLATGARECRQKWGVVAVSAHRADAFAACRYVIERVKQIAPIWKHEHFDGGDVWIEGATAEPDDEGARLEARKRACA